MNPINSFDDGNEDYNIYMLLKDLSFEEDFHEFTTYNNINYNTLDNYYKQGHGGLHKGKASNKQRNLALGNMILMQVSASFVLLCISLLKY